MSRLISLAAGVCPETGPVEFVDACASAGWPACGVWFDPDTWTDRTAHEVRLRLDDAGMTALDIEPLFVTPAGDHADRLLAAAASVGAENVLVVSRGVEPEPFTERFAEICDLAAGSGVACSVEFMAFMSTKNLAQALDVVRAAARPNAAILVDNLHLARTGGGPEDLASVEPSLLRYVQICDADAATPADLVDEALNGRLVLGDGELPVAALLGVVPPDTPISLEIRSAALRREHPDAPARASHVLATTRRFLERLGGPKNTQADR